MILMQNFNIICLISRPQGGYGSSIRIMIQPLQAFCSRLVVPEKAIIGENIFLIFL